MNCPFCKQPTNRILTNKLRKGENTKVYHCEICDLGFLETLNTTSNTQEYYQKEYRKEYTPTINQTTNAEELFTTYSPFQASRFQLLKSVLNHNTRLLEIGCSAGQFLYTVKDVVKEAVGIEYDVEAAQYARLKTACTVYTDDISKLDLPPESFDVVCAFQVLEHIPNPKDFLLNIHRLLKKGGTIFIEVPNLYDSLVSTYALPFHHQFYFHTAHLYYFSKKSISNLIQDCGFSGEVKFSQDYNLFNHIHWICNDQPQPNGTSGLSAPKPNFTSTTNIDITNQLNNFFAQIDKSYKELLCKNEISSNISFLGRKI